MSYFTRKRPEREPLMPWGKISPRESLESWGWLCRASHSVAATGVVGIRTCYPQIWQRCLLSISSWRNWETACMGRTFWSFPDGHKTFLREVPSLYWEEKRILIFEEEKVHREGSEWTGLAKFPSVYALSSSLPYHTFPLFIKPSIKTLRFNLSLGFHFLMKVLMSCKI